MERGANTVHVRSFSQSTDPVPSQRGEISKEWLEGHTESHRY